MKTLLQGRVEFVERTDNWSMEVDVKWTKRWFTTSVTSRQLHLKSDFESCALTQAHVLSFISRSDTFNFSGKKSAYSELLLESVETQCLMDSKNASIKLEGKCLIFKGSVRKKDINSLSNIFKLIEMLQNNIDSLDSTTSRS
ncbi:hypothetical protein [Psychroserpens algicola]|uniref:hypothetical protein n=1 Tax=Psychroserpens algicola TaxID=1719034 RepID=UPI0019536528|nr:hypothetical protein [Psychroserpens algicola]